MQFAQFMQQIERPYWSPVHPSQYIQVITKADSRVKVRMGWGLIYPDDIGGFNLMWLVSATGMPPTSYKPYLLAVRQVLSIAHYPVGGLTLKHRAATCNLSRFADLIQAYPHPDFALLLDAVRLRV